MQHAYYKRRNEGDYNVNRGIRTSLGIEEHGGGVTFPTRFELVSRAVCVGERQHGGGLSYEWVFRHSGLKNRGGGGAMTSSFVTNVLRHVATAQRSVRIAKR